MIILGLNFGHDGTVTVVKDGAVLSCIERERFTGLKHAIGITIDDVERALDDAGISVEDIDYCGVASTQGIESIFIDRQDVSFEYDPSPERHERAPVAAEINDEELQSRGQTRLIGFIRDGVAHPYVKRLTDNYKQSVDTLSCFPAIEDFGFKEEWTGKHSLSMSPGESAAALLSDANRLLFHLPVTVTVKGRKIPGFLCSHHYAHAAYAHFTSNKPSTAMISVDGSLQGGGYWNGMCYYGDGNRLVPLTLHGSTIGHLYERVAFLLNLGHESGAGKLMGLAPYGKPAFFDERFVVSHDEAADLDNPYSDVAVPGFAPDGRSPHFEKWIQWCVGRAQDLGYDIAPFGDTEQMLAPINVDIAQSTQKLLEETLLRITHNLETVLEQKQLSTPNLCLTGGVALNCPANSRIFMESGFDHVFVPPAVYDGGLSIGAALSVYFNVLDQERVDYGGNTPLIAYLGAASSTEGLDEALQHHQDDIRIVETDDPIAFAAQALAENHILTWYDGRSEIGPRALGHRSIVAHPGIQENWRRVNDIKRREYWRPFAPSVLKEFCDEWFAGAPNPSPFMLFTARVIQDKVPAITHVDGTARTQTVTEENGDYFKLLSAFHELTGIPMVLNTSFNGPGQPIVETPMEALSFFVGSKVDYLYLSGKLVTHK